MRRVRQYLTVEILSRVFADILMVNAGLISGLVARILGLLFMDSRSISALDIRDLFPESWFIYRLYAPLFTALCLAIFSISGFYTRGRAYRSRYKVIVVLQAISLAYLFLGFLTYFVPGLTRYPRSALFTGWIATAVSLIGARFWATTWSRVVRLEHALDVDAAETKGVGNVLVVGGAGYIGSLLCRQLLERGYRIRVLDALLYGDKGISSLYGRPNFEFTHGDTRDIEVVARAVRDMDAVVHLGEIVGDPAVGLDEQFALEINVAATQMVAQVAKGYGVQRFIYASSCSVYGASDELLNEQSNLNPVSLYARAKLDSESILLGLNARDFHPTILRFGTVYGLSPRQRFDLVINLLTAKALDDGEITIFGGDQWRPFVHASDAARAVVIVLEAPLANVKRQIFNIGSDGQNYTIVQLGEIIHKAVPDSTLVNLGTDTDNRDYRVSFAKANRQLGFDPQLSVEQGVKEIALAIQAGALEHYKERKYSNYRTLSDEYGCLDTRYGRITEVASRSQPTLDAKSFEVALRKPMAWQMGFLESIVELAAISMDSATLVANRQRSHDLAVESWFRSLDRCQREVEGHTLRVAEMAISLARESGMTEAELKHLGRGALLHDIGQLGIPAHVLVKPGPLSDDEWLIVHNHPVYAYEILSPIVNLRASLDIPYCHHERWDGTGYPRGLKEENIPLSARVFSVVDVWDTLLSDKPYRAAWSREDVAEYILSNAGTQFDPYVVDAFARVCPVFPKSQVEGLLPHKRLP